MVAAHETPRPMAGSGRFGQRLPRPAERPGRSHRRASSEIRTTQRHINEGQTLAGASFPLPDVPLERLRSRDRLWLDDCGRPNP